MKQQWPYLTGFGLALAGAAVALGYLVTGGKEQLIGVVAGCSLLAVAQLVLLGLQFSLDERRGSKLRRLAKDQADLRDSMEENINTVFSQIATLEASAQTRTQHMVRGVEEVKSAFEEFREKIRFDVANLQTRPMQAMPQAAEPAVVETAAEIPAATAAPDAAPSFEDLFSAPPEVTAAIADQITYALEPVVDIPTERTAHYRLHSSMNLGGEDMSGESLFHAASAAGIRSAIDHLAVIEALGLLQRLRQRDPQLCVLVPLGAETLQDTGSVEQIIALVSSAPEGGGLMIELPHVVLAGLGEIGLEGLALLARQGMTFALSQASVNGVDLDAMRMLNVRMLGLNAAKLGGGDVSQSLRGFSQMARLSRIGIYVTDVSNAAVVPHLSGVARLACGPCFAPPRRVRRVSPVQSAGAIAA